jgi:hypothetical protein
LDSRVLQPSPSASIAELNGAEYVVAAATGTSPQLGLDLQEVPLRR